MEPPFFILRFLIAAQVYGILSSMPDDKQKDEHKLFGLIIQNLGTVIKNSVLYPVSHPISEISIKNFKASLDKWFLASDVLDVGISQDSVLLSGEFVDKKNELYREVASHLHSHGISSLCFKKGLATSELTEMFRFLKKDAKLIREGGDPGEIVPVLEHILIGTVDYSTLLEGTGGAVSKSDEELWKSLTNVSQESLQGRLPREREEFIRQFLGDSRSSASVLNRIYRDAVSRMEGDDAVTRTRESIARIYDYISRNPDGVSSTAREDIGKIVSRLDPEFVMRLFSPARVDNRDFDLAGEMMKDVPDEFVAGFIESLIKSSGGFNENLLKVFERLSPGGAREGRIVSMVAGRFAEAQAVDNAALAEIQMSIKEVFAANPESSFMSQMYNLTVDTFVDRKAAAMDLPKELVAMVESYARSRSEENFKKQESELVLNLMWYENDPADYSRLCSRITGIVPELFRIRDIDAVKDIFMFFLGADGPGNRTMPGIKEENDRVTAFLNGESVIKQTLSFLASSDEMGAQTAAFVFNMIRNQYSFGMLLDEFCREGKPGRRNNLSLALKDLSEVETDVLAERVKSADPRNSGELYGLMREACPERARKLVVDIASIGDIALKRHILDGFVPGTEEEFAALMTMLRKEKDPFLVRKAVMAVLSGGDPRVVGEIFSYASGALAPGGLLEEIIDVSGEIGSGASVGHLGRIIEKRDILGRNEKIKTAAAVALGRIQSPEAIETLKRSASKAPKAVKDICDVILNLKGKKEESPAKGGISGEGYEG